MRYLALDFETGGLDYDKSAPVSIGIALMENGEVIDSYECVFAEFEKRDYTIKAMSINGIKWRDIQCGKPLAEAFKEIAAFVIENDATELPIVSHNAKFDQQFWDVLALTLGSWQGQYPNKKFVKEIELLRGPWYCTARMADPLRQDGKIPDCKLDSVCAYFGLSRSGETHGALEDAVLAGKVFDRLMAKVPA